MEQQYLSQSKAIAKFQKLSNLFLTHLFLENQLSICFGSNKEKSRKDLKIQSVVISNLCVSYSVVSDSLEPHGLLLARLLCSREFPGKNTGVGCYFLLQGIFQTQELNPGLPYCRQTLYCLSHQESPDFRLGNQSKKILFFYY